ncbi:MAG: Rnase Y domain-containing protein, partial [Salinivirgaceae bacterium]|nr:Rnase Y domain-containing protein [Salinivirgaceae bacterium]
MDVLTIIGLVMSFVGGVGLSFFLWQVMLRKRKIRTIEEGRAEAEVLKKDKILQAKEKFLELKNEHEKYINEKNAKISQQEQKLKQR